MQPCVHTAREQDEFDFREGCAILETWNSLADPAVSIARARVAPGVTTRWHRLDGVTERYLIQQGIGRVELARTRAQTVQPGAVVIIPPGCAQRITNNGDHDLVFLAICTPRFIPEIYVDMDAAP